jgi:hypothetical protein
MRPDSRTTLARLPWAGLLALLAVLALDRTAFGLHGTWAALAARDPLGVATPRLALLDASVSDATRPRVLVVGTSRVVDGFAARLAAEQLPAAEWVKVAHPRFDPFTIRALVPDLLRTHPDVVVFVWSELDTHRPLRLEPVPGSSAASLGALWELVRATGWDFAVENRQSLYRLAATSALDGYRYRAALFQAGLDERRRFTLDARLKPRRAIPRIFGDPVYWDARPNPVSPAERSELVASFGPEADPRFVDLSVDFVAEITPGRHVALQQGLLARSVELLREHGVEVIVIEGPLHPRAAELYDAGLRRDFLAFMARLQREQGVRFTPLEQLPAFEPGDFKDLLHTHGPGTRKLTGAVVRALRQALPAAG